MQRQKSSITHLTIATITRVLSWGKFMMSDPEYRWIATDTTTMGLLADEIRRLRHQNYLLDSKRLIKKK